MQASMTAFTRLPWSTARVLRTACNRIACLRGTGDTNAREQLLSLGGDALAEQLDSTEGASVNPEQLKAAAAAHARR